MGTYLYLQCADHNPPIVAEHESAQHLRDLPWIFDKIEHHVYLPEVIREGPSAWARLTDYEKATYSFLAQHPNCLIEVIDEYGVIHTPEEVDDAQD